MWVKFAGMPSITTRASSMDGTPNAQPVLPGFLTWVLTSCLSKINNHFTMSLLPTEVNDMQRKKTWYDLFIRASFYNIWPLVKFTTLISLWQFFWQSNWLGSPGSALPCASSWSRPVLHLPSPLCGVPPQPWACTGISGWESTEQRPRQQLLAPNWVRYPDPCQKKGI